MNKSLMKANKPFCKSTRQIPYLEVSFAYWPPN